MSDEVTQVETVEDSSPTAPKPALHKILLGAGVVAVLATLWIIAGGLNDSTSNYPTPIVIDTQTTTEATPDDSDSGVAEFLGGVVGLSPDGTYMRLAVAGDGTIYSVGITPETVFEQAGIISDNSIITPMADLLVEVVKAGEASPYDFVARRISVPEGALSKEARVERMLEFKQIVGDSN